MAKLKRPSLLASVKASVALHSTTHRPDQLRASTVLREAGIDEQSLADVAKSLESIAHSKGFESWKAGNLASSPNVSLDMTLGEFASVALVEGLPCESFGFPNGPNPNECELWKFDSYFCRVKAAIEDWAAHPPVGGVKADTKLGPLRPPFNDASCSRLIQSIRDHDVFDPFDVAITDICGSLSGDTTALQLATTLWEAHPNHCKVHVSFP
jgi:hypothetical protein